MNRCPKNKYKPMLSFWLSNTQLFTIPWACLWLQIYKYIVILYIKLCVVVYVVFVVEHRHRPHHWYPASSLINRETNNKKYPWQNYSNGCWKCNEGFFSQAAVASSGSQHTKTQWLKNFAKKGNLMVSPKDPSWKCCFLEWICNKANNLDI